MPEFGGLPAPAALLRNDRNRDWAQWLCTECEIPNEKLGAQTVELALITPG